MLRIGGSTIGVGVGMLVVAAIAQPTNGGGSGIQIDMSISIGNLLTIVTFLIGGIGFVYTIRSDVHAQGDRLDAVEAEMKKLAEILIAQGRQDERLNAMDRRIEDLRRGDGWIVPPGLAAPKGRAER